MENMDLSNAEVAVTTQHILDGKEYKDYWVQMSDYSDMGEFLCACSDLFPEEEEPEKSFTDLLDSFFTTRNTIKENLKQLGNGMPDMEKKERVRIKGFAAYKDNSTELKGE